VAETHEVLVVGAGISGLTVTTELAAAGVDVVCLEARERVGGRLLSADSATGSLDLGASWFWPGEHRVQRLCATLGVEVFDSYCAGDAVYEPASGAYRLNGNPIGMPAYRYADGAHSLTRILADRLPSSMLRLNSPVISVDSDATSLVVATGQQTIRTKHLVLAIPPALVASAIRFNPPLSPTLHRVAANTPVWMGATTKVVVHYHKPFWRNQGLSGAALSAIGPLGEVHDLSGRAGHPAALFGFTASAASCPVSQRNLCERAVDQLVRLFGPQAADPIAVVILDWSAEVYTAPPRVAELYDYSLFGHPLYSRAELGGRLHWASTETSTVSAGHIEGALAAAERVTQVILAAM
jgi:monoamine oxidase